MNNDIVNIKGTRNGLVICLDSNHDFEEIKRTLKSKIESSRGFFKGAKFTFYLDRDTLSIEKTKELEDICCENGLVIDNQINWPGNVNSEAATNKITLPETPREKAMAANVRPLMREASPSIPTVGVNESDRKPCMLVHRSLRSGQKVHYDGNVVIFGDVNPGSEITATGDIIVIGSLRGVVHAGANGDNSAIIMAYRLTPVQLRIGSTISRPPENSLPSNYPEIARIQMNRMVIEPYVTHGLK